MLTDLRPAVERILRQFLLAGLPVVAVACDDGGVRAGGAGGSPTGGTGGSSMGGEGGASVIGMGGADTGGAGGANTGGAGPACHPIDVQCGSPPSCVNTATGSSIPLPLSSSAVSFDPADPQWAALWEACAAMSPPVCMEECRDFCSAVVFAKTGRSGGLLYPGCKIDCADPGKITIRYLASVCGRRVVDGEGTIARGHAPRSLGEYLAESAQLEAESVPAFRRVGDALSAYGAPSELVRAARVAMAEEARHWRRTRELARKHGVEPTKPTMAARPFASLEALALENVVEGCVRETFGAMVAARQASEAADPDVRALMTDIAREEMGHAALSWKIDAWARSSLGQEFSARRKQAAVGALAELLAASQQPADGGVLAATGLPSPEESHALLAVAWTHLWEPSFAEAQT